MPNYRLKTNTGAFRQHAVVSADDVKNQGANIEDWKRQGFVEETNDPVADAPTMTLADLKRPLTDAENKAEIERVLADEDGKRGQPMSHEDKSRRAAELTKQHTDPARGNKSSITQPAPTPGNAPAPAAAKPAANPTPAK